MAEPTLNPVQPAGRRLSTRRRLAIITVVTVAALLTGLLWSAPSADSIVATVSLVASQAGLDDRPGEAVGPPAASPKKRATGRPSRTPRTEDVTWDRTFTSDLFGYTLRYPSGWTTRAATSADLSDWFKAPLPSMTALSIRRTSRPAGAGLPAFAESHLPHRADHSACSSHPEGRDGLHEITVHGRGGAYRSECGFVDALVMDSPGFLQITLWPDTTRSGSVWWFERFVEQLEFPEEGTTPAPTATDSREDAVWEQTFTSDRFGFSIRYPDGWIPVPGVDSKPDRILAPPPSGTVLSVRRSPMPEGVEFLDFAEEHLRHRVKPDGCHWVSGIIYISAAWDTLHEIAVDGHAGAYRSECSHVDAVVEDGDEFLAITLQSGTKKSTGDLWWFERFVETVEIDDDPEALEEST